MKTRRIVDSLLMRKMAILVLALASMLMLVSLARAEAPSPYQPRSLIESERALEQGQPARALSHLHRARAILRHEKFRLQREALACQAYIQLQELEKAASVCNEVVAYDDDGPGAKVTVRRKTE